MSASVRGVIHLCFSVIYLFLISVLLSSLFPTFALEAVGIVVFMVSHSLSMEKRSNCLVLRSSVYHCILRVAFLPEVPFHDTGLTE